MKYLAPFFAVVLSGCTTIYFDNGEVAKSESQSERWHHNFFFALYEQSDPVDLSRECRNTEWNYVKTELSFINYIAGNVVNALFGPFWSPKTVEVSCRDLTPLAVNRSGMANDRRNESMSDAPIEYEYDSRKRRAQMEARGVMNDTAVEYDSRLRRAKKQNR